MIKFFKDEKGATAIEYGLIAAGIAVVILSSLFFIGGETGVSFCEVATGLNGKSTQYCNKLELMNDKQVSNSISSSLLNTINNYDFMGTIGSIDGYYQDDGTAITTMDQMKSYINSGKTLYMSPKSNGVSFTYKPPFGTKTVQFSIGYGASYGAIFVS